jgi:hypothetical protein
LARLYRQAPLNSVWEGSGNVICLDVVRVLQREPEALAVMLDEIRLGRSNHPDIARNIDRSVDLGARQRSRADGARNYRVEALNEQKIARIY